MCSSFKTVFGVITTTVLLLPFCYTNVENNNKILIPWEISTNINDVSLYVYKNVSEVNTEKEIKFMDEESLFESCFCPNILTIFIIPGFGASRNSSSIQMLINGYVTSGFEANIVVLDWSKLSGAGIIIITDAPTLYLIAVGNVPRVALRLAKFMEWMNSRQVLNLNKVHLVGHSLGAQLSGETGFQMQKMYPGFKLSRITGLDPAGPLYWPQTPARNLEKGDAHFVDVIHANAWLYGDTTVNGHVDFFPNGGSVQPGCNLITNIAFCSHLAAIALFVATFKSPFIACQCSMRQMDEISFNQCMKRCPNPVLMGVPCPHTARGEYFLWTKQVVNTSESFGQDHSYSRFVPATLPKLRPRCTHFQSTAQREGFIKSRTE